MARAGRNTDAFDDLALVCPLAGVIGGIVVQSLVARAHERRVNAWLSGDKRIET